MPPHNAEHRVEGAASFLLPARHELIELEARRPLGVPRLLGKHGQHIGHLA
jgi:hypothetical protein